MTWNQDLKVCDAGLVPTQCTIHTSGSSGPGKKLKQNIPENEGVIWKTYHLRVQMRG